ncbi:MAG: dTDP-4-dehydrorhamnose 3,5-epimerase [Bacteroidetes bacterium]|nr:dTDP-4-dehydrorhamnose 3,5-epimerase [Bacteroidota bacterium]
MKVIETGINGLLLIEPRVFEDARGYFFESYNQAVFSKNGISDQFVQDNQSMSMKGAVRGLHFQKNPHAQAKLVRVVKGKVLDVAVDIRKNSPTYAKVFAAELSEKNKLMMYIPVGFAHGFATLEDYTIFQYKCSDFYYPETEGGIFWNDKDLNIQWNVDAPIVSDKDSKLPFFEDFDSPF